MPEDVAGAPVQGDPRASRRKPTIAQLGIDLAAQDWQRSGSGDGSFEVAFVRRAATPEWGAGSSATPRSRAGSSAVGPSAGAGSGSAASSAAGSSAGAGSGTAASSAAGSSAGAGDVWVLLRVAGDPAGRVLVYDRTEWECFLDGVARGEFDDGPE